MLISETHRQIQDAARQFATKAIAPHAAAWDRGDHSSLHPEPKAVLQQMGPLGFMGMCIDPQYGGAGTDFVSYVLVTEEIAAADCGLCNMMCVNNSPNCAAIQDHGNDWQCNEVLPALARGELSSAFLLTEPQAGSDAAALQTIAVREGDEYVINGTKQFVTAGRSADWALIVAVTDPSMGKKGMSCFLARTDASGYVVVREEDKMGHRAADTCQILLDNLRVPAANLLGREGDGYRIALAYLENGRIGVAAQALGVARAAFELAKCYANERETFGRAIAQHQAIAFQLADMATAIASARALTHLAAHMKDAGISCLKEASMAKLHASEMAMKVCSDAVQIHGGYGYLKDFPVEKLMRDARVLPIYEGTNEIQRLVISRAL